MVTDILIHSNRGSFPREELITVNIVNNFFSLTSDQNLQYTG